MMTLLPNHHSENTVTQSATGFLQKLTKSIEAFPFIFEISYNKYFFVEKGLLL